MTSWAGTSQRYYDVGMYLGHFFLRKDKQNGNMYTLYATTMSAINITQHTANGFLAFRSTCTKEYIYIYTYIYICVYIYLFIYATNGI